MMIYSAVGCRCCIGGASTPWQKLAGKLADLLAAGDRLGLAKELANRNYLGQLRPNPLLV